MEIQDLKEGEIVTLNLSNDSVSNTFVLAQLLDNGALLTHPLSPNVFIKVNQIDLNQVSPTIRCSAERILSFISKNKDILDFNSKNDLESICISFVIKRLLTPKQKKIIADLGGKAANVKFNGNIRKAIDYIIENEAVLDDFNKMWYNNFAKLFNGNQEISSAKQTNAIFNIAGFVLGEFEGNLAPQT